MSIAQRPGSRRKKDPEMIARRINRVLELRRQRKSWRDIAEIISEEFEPVSHAQLHRLYNQELTKIPKAMADFHRAEALEQLDDLEAKSLAIMAKFHFATNNNGVILLEDGTPLEDTAPALEAVRTLVAIQQRKAKLLGLDAPTQVQATVRAVTETDVALAGLIADMERANVIEAQAIEGEIDKAMGDQQ